MRLQIKALSAALVVLAVLAVRVSVSAAPTTWMGKISDAMCAADHKENGGTEAKDHDCAVKCAKGGSEYVFVSDKDHKIFKIANQKFAGLETHAGHHISLTGDLQGDKITVTKIDMPKAK